MREKKGTIHNRKWYKKRKRKWIQHSNVMMKFNTSNRERNYDIKTRNNEVEKKNKSTVEGGEKRKHEA